jgi:L-lysine 2,3-aminomutase
MRRGDWGDPLLRQVWPHSEEDKPEPGLSTDPLVESHYNPEPGLLHKYTGRVLLNVAPHCAVHCRYCFRRHFDYASNTPSRHQWQKSLDHVRKDPDIKEVIFSGGDPLSAPDRQLAWLLRELDAIEHLQTLRIHTRFPLMIPQRVTDSLIETIAASRLRSVIVLHCNHANELLGEDIRAALEKLRSQGSLLLNQAVLLAAVNDSVEAQISLNKTLFTHQILPYYLHMPDPVAGTRHFQVSEARAKTLMAEIRSQLPGYLVPRLVREIPGSDAKTLLA